MKWYKETDELLAEIKRLDAAIEAKRAEFHMSDKFLTRCEICLGIANSIAVVALYGGILYLVSGMWKDGNDTHS